MKIKRSHLAHELAEIEKLRTALRKAESEVQRLLALVTRFRAAEANPQCVGRIAVGGKRSARYRGDALIA